MSTLEGEKGKGHRGTRNRVMRMLTMASKPGSKEGNNYMKVGRISEKW